MKFLTTNGRGILLCLIIAIPAWILGTLFPIIGGPVIAILLGMLLAIPLKEKGSMAPGIQFTSKKILQWAVILLGFGLDLTVVLKTGQQSLPIILCTITVSLLIAFLLYKVLPIPAKSATLIGVGSSICGGSAIAATAPVINADDEEVAQSISVIFFFNVLAAIIFPILGNFLGFSTTSGEGFGIFAGTAVNDTSSVTAAASTWDSMWGVGQRHLGQSRYCEAHPHLGHHPHCLGSCLPASKARAERERAKGKAPHHLPLFHPLLHPCQPHHHHRRVPWGGCQCLLPHQDPQQVFALSWPWLPSVSTPILSSW